LRVPTAQDDPQLLQFDDPNITPQHREYDHTAILDAHLTGHDIPKTDFSNEFHNTADQETKGIKATEDVLTVHPFRIYPESMIKTTCHCEISSTRCLKFFYHSLRIYYELMNCFSRFRWFSLAFTTSCSK
jgi:hypothetical protein